VVLIPIRSIWNLVSVVSIPISSTFELCMRTINEAVEVEIDSIKQKEIG